MPVEPFGCLHIERLKAVRIIHEPFNNVTDPPDDEEYKDGDNRQRDDDRNDQRE